MVKEDNITQKVNQSLKGNIYIILEEKEKNILKKDQYMKANIYFIENGTEKDMMKMVI